MTTSTTRPRLGQHHSPLVERVLYGLARARAWARRATLPGLSVRGAIWLAGTAALVLAVPPQAWPGPLPVIAALVALPAAAAPGGGWPFTVEVLAVGIVAVLVATSVREPSLVELVGFGALLYLHHTSAALGAQLRTDAVVRPAVPRHWAGRAGVVLAASAVLSVGIATLAGQAPAWSATGFVALGVAGALAATAGVIWLVRRPPDR